MLQNDTPRKQYFNLHNQGFKPGESTNVRCVIRPEMLGRLNAQQKRVIEPGECMIREGSSSREIHLYSLLDGINTMSTKLSTYFTYNPLERSEQMINFAHTV